MKKYLFVFALCLTINNAQSIETKIIYKIQNEIITNIDIKNEFKYLVALNNKLKDLNNKQILNISNQSIIREKIKKIEIKKNFKEIKINEEYLNFLIKNIISDLNLKSKNEFELYLQDYSLILSDIENKVTIDALWNQLIMQKYSKQITIDEKIIREKISKIGNIPSKDYELSEIIFEVKNKNEIKSKYKEIIKSIGEIGFQNTAAIYSFSQSAPTGGYIGWISENSLNDKIKKNISYLKIGEISDPILLSNGALILNVTNIKKSKINIDIENEVKKAVDYERNRQLNQYSKIYYNKIKKNLEFNE